MIQSDLLSHWEAFHSISETLDSIKKLVERAPPPIQQHFVSLPYSYLEEGHARLSDLNVILGCNDMNAMEMGSFTCAIAPKLLLDKKVHFVLLNTALKRHLKEPPLSINHKIKASLENGITPFVCFGETQAEFEDGKTFTIIKQQLQECLKEIDKRNLNKIKLIYDTPWLLKSTSDINKNDFKQLNEALNLIINDLFEESIINEIKFLCFCQHIEEIGKNTLENSIFSGFYFKNLI